MGIRRTLACAATVVVLAACGTDPAAQDGTAGTGGTGGSAGLGGFGGVAGAGGFGGADSGADAQQHDASQVSIDAGSGDAAADAAPPKDAEPAGDAASPSGCAGATYQICEDFEATATGAIPDGWTARGDASKVSVTDAEHHGGSHALWLGPVDVWERRIARDASQLGPSHWGRIHYKVATPVPDAFVHSTLVAFEGTGPQGGKGEYRVVDTVKAAFDATGIENRHQFLYNVQPSGAELGTGTSYDWTFDAKWHCVEWFVDATTQTYLFYYEGSEEIRIENGAGNYNGTDLPSGFSQLRIGWINYQNSPPGFTAYLDDLAIDDTRIGCK